MLAASLYKASLLFYIVCFVLNWQVNPKNTSPLFRDSVRIESFDSVSVSKNVKTDSLQSEFSKANQQAFSNYKPYIDLFSALLTPLIAIIATYIAFQQWQTNRLKLRHDRYERRLVIFKATMKFIAIPVQTATFQQEDLYEFQRETSESYFLFNDDVREFIDELYSNAVDLHRINLSLHRNSNLAEEERKQIVIQNGELLKWFGRQFEISRKVFGKYLRILE
ncbi:MAG: hypothetical protein ALAOOOJD_02793 [bacterium]|nr:hypothetical protein [bacterium]